MTTRTITVEALAAALHACDIPPSEPYRSTPERDLIGHAKDAAAIFAALPAEPARPYRQGDREGRVVIVSAEPADAGLREFVEWHAQLETPESDDPGDDGYRFISETDLRILADFVAALAATPEEA